MGETYTVKLAKRSALLRLNNEVCKVKIKSYSGEYTTGGKLTTLTNGNTSVQLVKVNELNEMVVVDMITHIEVPISRFTPDKKSFMEVDWENGR